MSGARVLVTAALILGLAGAFVLPGCTPATQEPPRLQVVTCTSLLEYIVQRVGGDFVDVANIIPPSQHPGDFDATPGDIRKLADADIFMVHGWPGETFVPSLVKSADNPKLLLSTIQVDGNWMTPQVQMDAADLVAAVLSQKDADNADSYQRAADQYKTDVVQKNQELQARLRDGRASGTPTLCAFWQVEFARWAGLWVVGTYGPAELTLQSTQDLVDSGREAGVLLVVDNLQSGRDAGKAVAEELGCARVILSNFPGAYDDTDTWEKAVDRNVEMILEAVGQ